MPVHHIDMNPVRTGFIDRAHLFTQTSEVCGQDGRSDKDGALHEPNALTTSESVRNSAGV